MADIQNTEKYESYESKIERKEQLCFHLSSYFSKIVAKYFILYRNILYKCITPVRLFLFFE